MVKKTKEKRIKEEEREVSGAIKGAIIPPIPSPPEKKGPIVVPEEVARERARVSQAEREAVTGGAPQVMQGGATIKGRTYLGLSPEEINLIKEQQGGGVPIQEATTKKEAIKSAQTVGQLQPELLQNMQEASPNWEQALTAGVVKGAIPSAIGYAGAGAAAGALGGPAAPVTVPTGAIIGGIFGLIKGIYSNTLSNIETQKKGEINAAVDVLSYGKNNMRQMVILASQDPANADRYVDAYNKQLTLIHRARSQIKLETQGNLDKFIEDGRDILSDFDLFLDEGGLADSYGEKLRIALASGISLTEEDIPEDLKNI